MKRSRCGPRPGARRGAGGEHRNLVPHAALAALLLCLGLGPPVSAYEQQIATQAKAIAEELAASEVRALAVVDFTDLQGDVTELGRFLAEELSLSLAGAGQGFEVVDRTHLKAILQEHKLSATGLIDPTTARELGRIAGVGALITGTVTPLGDSVRLAVKVLDTECARIVSSSTTNVPKTQAIETLLRREILTGGPTRPPGREPAASNQTAEEVGFLFRLRRCVLSGERLVCSLTVANQQEDCQLTVYKSRAIDEYGDQYESAQVAFAGRSAEGWVREVTVQGIPTGITLTFANLAPNTSRLALLEVRAKADRECSRVEGRSKDLRAQFRDVPVYRE